MIKVTQKPDNVCIINPDKILNMCDFIEKEKVAGAYVHFTDQQWIVCHETKEEVARKVLEYRLAMERFRVSYQSITNLLLPNEINTEHQAVMRELHRVSGLSAEKGADK